MQSARTFGNVAAWALMEQCRGSARGSGTSVEGKCVLLGFSDCLIQEDAHRYLRSLSTFYSPFPM